MLDLLITGGMVIDGTGRDGVRADIGIRDGYITSVGRRTDAARRTIDAMGLVVAPGFIDVHTHYDAQVLWDPYLSPSHLHGITTVIGGNCGFTIAPMHEKAAGYVTRMLSRVEGIPLEALEAGIDFAWSSFAEYLSRIEGRTALNVGFLVGHSTLRRLVMGEAAVGGKATPAHLAGMCALLRSSLGEGALGFSTSWASAHNDLDGNPVPSRAASDDECLALAGVARTFSGTTLEVAPPMYGTWGEREIELMIGMSLACGKMINWNPAKVREEDPASVEWQLAIGTRAAQRGARVLALAYPFPSETQLSLSRAHLYDNIPGWADTMRLPIEERIRVFTDPLQRARLAAAAAIAKLPPITHYVNWSGMRFERFGSAKFQRLVGQKVGDIAASMGKSPFDTYLDIAVEDKLNSYVSFPTDPDSDVAWRLRCAMWRDPRALLGGSDAGAHLDSTCNANFSTRFLAEAVMKRQLLPLEEAVRLMTDVPARSYGLEKRGRLAEGWHADIVVFDPGTVGAKPLHIRNDFPAHAPRLYSEGDGIVHLIVNGIEVMRGTTPTGHLPGTVLRSRRNSKAGK